MKRVYSDTPVRSSPSASSFFGNLRFQAGHPCPLDTLLAYNETHSIQVYTSLLIKTESFTNETYSYKRNMKQKKRGEKMNICSKIIIDTKGGQPTNIVALVALD